jgi:hypothetical protein
LEKFNLGKFLDRKDLGEISMDIDVDGKGFTEKYLTGIKGDVTKIEYSNYTYNVVVDGILKYQIILENL